MPNKKVDLDKLFYLFDRLVHTGGSKTKDDIRMVVRLLEENNNDPNIAVKNSYRRTKKGDDFKSGVDYFSPK